MEVTNFPEVQDVSVVGPGVPVPRVQLIGFTSQFYTGNMDGNFGATRMCQLEFARSGICKSQEVALTRTLPEEFPSSLAWNTNAQGFGGCKSDILVDDVFIDREWSTNVGSTGIVTDTTGSVSGGADCSIQRSIACCGPVGD